LEATVSHTTGVETDGASRLREAEARIRSATTTALAARRLDELIVPYVCWRRGVDDDHSRAAWRRLEIARRLIEPQSKVT